MVPRLSFSLLLFFCAGTAFAEARTVSARERAETFVKGFQAICFDTDWMNEKEAWSLHILGFEPVMPDETRRWYKLGDLFLASFLSGADNETGRPACFLEAKAVSPSLVRHEINDWKDAGAPLADEIQNGDRTTMWDVSYRRHSGTVMLHEETSRTSTLVTLMLIGE